MESVKIREGKPEDAQGVMDIWNPAILNTLATFERQPKTLGQTAEFIKARAAPGTCFLVAEGTAGISGFATYRQFRRGTGYDKTLEHTIMISGEARSQGIGRLLMSELEARAKAFGAASLWAGVSSANPGAEAFHRRIGFAHVATLPEVGHKFGRWLDLVLLRKTL